MKAFERTFLDLVLLVLALYNADLNNLISNCSSVQIKKLSSDSLKSVESIFCMTFVSYTVVIEWAHCKVLGRKSGSKQ